MKRAPITPAAREAARRFLQSSLLDHLAPSIAGAVARVIAADLLDELLARVAETPEIAVSAEHVAIVTIDD